MEHELTRTSPTKVRVFRYPPETTEQETESRFQHKARNVETDCLDCRDKSTTSRATRGVGKNKGRKIETEARLQRAERLEVLGNTRNERLRRRQDYDEQSDSRSETTKSEMEATTSRATGSVEQNKATFKIEIQHLNTLR